MTGYRSLSHTKWTCQYHVVFIPKYRKKVICGELRRDLGEVLRRLAQQRESEVEEGHLMADHVHIMLSIPPKVLRRAGDRVYQGEERDPHRPALCGAAAQLRRATLLGPGGTSCPRSVETNKRFRTYIRDQEQEERRQEQLKLDPSSHL